MSYSAAIGICTDNNASEFYFIYDLQICRRYFGYRDFCVIAIYTSIYGNGIKE